MADRIDAHQHFWLYDPNQYGWITEQMATLRRNFLPRDLSPELHAQGIAASIAVQARQTVEETQWLLSLADTNSNIAGVVGWLPLCSQTLEGHLDSLPQPSKLKGLRHVLQDELTDDLVTSEPFNRGIAVLTRRNLVYDILIYQHQLPPILDLVDRHPDQVFVLDHIGKPRIADRLLEPWRRYIRELARRPNVSCKLSGMVTEAEWKNWSPATLQPYYEAVLEAFGPGRLMYGSDWPVCLLAAEYSEWYCTTLGWTSALSAHERSEIFGGTAQRVYNLGVIPPLKGRT